MHGCKDDDYAQEFLVGPPKIHQFRFLLKELNYCKVPCNANEPTK